MFTKNSSGLTSLLNIVPFFVHSFSSLFVRYRSLSAHSLPFYRSLLYPLPLSNHRVSLSSALFITGLVRRVLSQLVLDRQLFDGQPCERLEEADTFPTKYISEILAEEDGSYKTCRRICDELEVPMHGSADYFIIREVCHAVSLRSASIVAAAISALLEHLQQSRVKIGVGGALIQFHPTYHGLLRDKLKDLAPHNVSWELVPADEGSARGAALIAAVAEMRNL